MRMPRGWWGDGGDNDWKIRNEQSVKEELESDNASHHRRRKTKLSKVGDASTSTPPSDRILNIILETGCQRTKWRNEGQNRKCVLGILLHEGNTVFWHIRDSIKCTHIFPIIKHWIFYHWGQIFVAVGGGGADGSDGGYGDDVVVMVVEGGGGILAFRRT